MNALLKYDYGSIKDPRLYEVTDHICNMLIDINEDCFAIAALVAKVEDDNLLYNDDFDDICDYVKKCFGFEKTTAYNLLKIGREYLVTFENGNIQTLLKHGVRDYSISQVVKMLPLGVEKAKELTRDEVITPDMSCRQIEKIVKQNLKRQVVDQDDLDEDIIEDDPIPDESEDDHVGPGRENERCELCRYYKKLKHNFIRGKGFEESHACVVWLDFERCPPDEQWIQEVDSNGMCELFERGD